jgi:hypothetical protein
MSSDAAKAMYPGLAKQSPSPDKPSRVRAGYTMADAMYGKEEPKPITLSSLRGKVPMTYESLSRVPGLKPKRR